MVVTLSDLVRAARARRAPLAGESAGYLVLALTDQVSHAPRVVHALDVELTEDGGVRVTRGQASSDADAEIALRAVLDDLLSVASSPNAALLRAGRRAPPTGLPALLRELEAALIPVNRGAARRALARLQRETARSLASGQLGADESGSAIRMAAARVAEGSGSNFERSSRQALPVALALPHAQRPDPEPTPGPSELNGDLTIAIDMGPLTLVDEQSQKASGDEQVARGSVPGGEGGDADRLVVDLPVEECTRPEPILLRHARRAFSDSEPEAPVFTPSLGTVVNERPTLDAGEAHDAGRSSARLIACSALADECTESMPQVGPVLPNVAIVPSRKSDLAELLDNFQVAEGDPRQALGRAIKEMAELDLTPAWSKS